MPTDYHPLDAQTVRDYVRTRPELRDLFRPDEGLEAVEVGDGNLNLVFKVWAGAEPSRSIIIKQALPYLRLVGDSWPLPTDRARIEAEALQIEYQLVPQHTPRVYFYDPDQFLIAMQNLDKHIVMRQGLIQGVQYPHFAEHIGLFLAMTLGGTSDLVLDYKTKKKQVKRFINPELCKITEDLVFTEPYRATERNQYHAEIEPQVLALQADDALRAEVAHMKENFMTQAQALIHGDLHTGSIMVNQTETYVIDPEFAFYGPIGFDVGAVIGNLFLNYAAQEARMPDLARRAAYQKYLTDTVVALWKAFARRFDDHIWSQTDPINYPRAYRDGYMLRILQDAAGFSACKMMRRVIGLAGVADLRGIADVTGRFTAESLALNIAQSVLMQRSTIHSIEDWVALAVACRPSYPWPQ